MSRRDSLPTDDLVKIRVPFSIRKRGGRKLIVVPSGATPAPDRPRLDNAMMKALARAFRWRKILETGTHGTIGELARAEKINASYVSRVLRLTLLAPCIVDRILDGRQPPNFTLAEIMKPFPSSWEDQLGAVQRGQPRRSSSDR